MTLRIWLCAVLVSSVITVSCAFAKDVAGPCKTNKVLPAHALYKAENVHGGRGPTLITSYGNTQQWPNCGTLKIYNANGKKIAAFGCYDPGHLPYGRRFYTGVPGGSYSDASEILRGARRARSTKIYIDVSDKQRQKGTCWVVKSPLLRQGGI